MTFTIDKNKSVVVFLNQIILLNYKYMSETSSLINAVTESQLQVLSHSTYEREKTIKEKLEHWAIYAKKGMAENTLKAIISDFKQFTRYCGQSGCCSLPATPATVEDFLEAHSEIKSVATITRYVSSISTIHKASAQDNPCESTEVKMTLKQIKRLKGTAQGQATPMNYDDLQSVISILSANPTLRNLRDAALLSCAYDGLLRGSELIAITNQDIKVSPCGTGAILNIKRGKSDQEGRGSAQYLSQQTFDLIKRYQKAAGGSKNPSQHLFRGIRATGYRAMHDRIQQTKISTASVQRVFENAALVLFMSCDINTELKNWTTHSARVGAAQDLATANFSLPEIQQTGRWKSPVMVSRYIRNIEASRSAMSRFRRQKAMAGEK